jgi:hypothetical protein
MPNVSHVLDVDRDWRRKTTLIVNSHRSCSVVSARISSPSPSAPQLAETEHGRSAC